MVADTSALVAILFEEAEGPHFVEAIAADSTRLISAATLLEASIVLEIRRGDAGIRDLDRLLREASFRVVPVDAEQAEVARQAFRTYGKGRHPAGLNFSDCFSYALAKSSYEPLLFKGADFARTDILPAL